LQCGPGSARQRIAAHLRCATQTQLRRKRRGHPDAPRAELTPGGRTARAGDRKRDERYRYAALMIAAGVNVKALSTFMGHANIGITLDPVGRTR
jgi:hypothetical protein